MTATPPASGLRRAAALLGDTCVSALPVPLALMMGWLDDAAFHVPTGWFATEWWLSLWLDNPATITAPVLWTLILGWIWHGIWWIGAGRTPAERVFGMEVVDASLSPASRGRMLVRTLMCAATLGTLGLGYMWIFVSRERRAAHDLLSGTWVLRTQ